jgi:hypothetical protein
MSVEGHKPSVPPHAASVGFQVVSQHSLRVSPSEDTRAGIEPRMMARRAPDSASMCTEAVARSTYDLSYEGVTCAIDLRILNPRFALLIDFIWWVVLVQKYFN